MKVENKVIIVTGAASGIGKELVLQLLQKGARVAALDQNPSKLDELVAIARNERLATFVLDISELDDVERIVNDVYARFGVIDGLINNAGIIQPFKRVNELSYALIDKVMKVNFNGPVYLIKTILPHLLQRPEAHIVNISSMGGFLPVPGQTIYGASKAALKLLTEGLYAELINTSVHVTVVFPGAVNTNISENSGVNPIVSDQPSSMKILAADKAASIILAGMEQNKFRILVGSDSTFMDWFYRLSPLKAVKLISDKMKGLLAN